MKKILGVFLLCLNVTMFYSQIINHEDVVKVKFSIEQKENEAFVVAKITIIPGWHINSFKLPKNSYAIETDIKLNPQGNFVIKELIEPKPNQYIDEDLGDIQSHHKGTLVMKRKILVNSVTDFNLTGVFLFQVCEESGKCLIPHEYPISLKVKGSAIVTAIDSITTVSKDIKDMHLGPQNIMVFHDLEKAEAYAKEVHKPLFVDFTGHACVNCRKMEEKVWGEPGILEILRDKMVIVSLYVDEKTALPASEHKELEYAPGKKMKITQVGHKWSYLQTTRYKSNTQPYYRLLGPKNEDLDIGSADYEHHGNAADFKAWLEKGLLEYSKAEANK